jgi:hypothetical protein
LNLRIFCKFLKNDELLNLALVNRYWKECVFESQNFSISVDNDSKYLKESFPNYFSSIYFSYEFNQRIKVGVLPKSLKKLIFDKFDYPIEPGVLPNRLEILVLGDEFNQPIEPDVFTKITSRIIF